MFALDQGTGVKQICKIKDSGRVTCPQMPIQLNLRIFDEWAKIMKARLPVHSFSTVSLSERRKTPATF